jgi:hypothetical protein
LLNPSIVIPVDALAAAAMVVATANTTEVAIDSETAAVDPSF